MAKNEESTKKTKVNNDINNEKNTIIKETITYDNTPIFNKMLVCLYIIIALLALNIIISAIKGSNNSSETNKKTTTTTTEAIADYDVSSFRAINTDEFIEAFNGSENTLIYLGRPDCGFCIKFVPVLTEVQNKYKFQTLYLDINTVSQEDANRIIALDNDFFTAKDTTAYGYTPMTLIVKDGKIIDSQVGHSSVSTLEALVSKYFDKK